MKRHAALLPPVSAKLFLKLSRSLFGTLCAMGVALVLEAALFTPHAFAQARVQLRRGLVITQSVVIVPKVYNLAAHPSVDSALIVIRGDNITVDFAGAELRGAARTAFPDEAAGVAVRVEGGRNVRVINARIRGYRVGIMAIGTHGLQLAHNDLSHNWKPRLFSLVEHESLADWMSFHKNENREWLRFGAGIYLENVVGGEIEQNTVEQGSNGLLMARTDSVNVHDNSFSFNSALGIGLYRSSDNRIVGNTVDYNVRGYSHGFFRRGQDSAALLLYEQSSRNVVAWNSMTHSGDGLFLWAGQSTMDTGQGGANDNLFFANDFSFAPTNGMEATFSRNDFVANRIEGSDHGLWGGYSFNSQVIGNCFQQNRIAIAIEHGQYNLLASNKFVGDSTGVYLWANAIEPSDWGYPKQRDTKSRDYRIRDNVFTGVPIPYKVENTTVADSGGNRYGRGDSARVAGGAATTFGRAPASALGTPITTGVEMGKCDPAAAIPDAVMQIVAPRLQTSALQALRRPMPSSTATLRKRNAIVVDEWGPFDWRSPKLWPIDSTHSAAIRFRVLGPAGRWQMVSRRGVAAVSMTSGVVGDTVVVTPGSAPDGTPARDWSVTLEYRGAATVSPRGDSLPADAPVRFSYEMFEPLASWNVRFFAWSDSTDPRTRGQAFQQLLRQSSLLARTEPRLDYMWYRPSIKDLPATKYAVVATTRLNVPAGVHSIRSISDDAVRVWIDGKLAIDNWAPHESEVNYATIAPGAHTLRVEYVQVEGWTELRVEVVKGSHRSVGTAGPH